MNCPNCGTPIKEGEIMCSACRMPVALMSGNPTAPTPIAPSTSTSTYVDPASTVTSMSSMEMPTYVEKDSEATLSNQYKNYGEGKKPVTSLKFILPILMGTLLLIFVLFGVYMVVKMYVQDRKSNPSESTLATYQVDFNGYIYTLSGDLTYSKDTASNVLHIDLSDNTWSSSLQIIESTYASARGRKNALKSYFQSLGYIASDVKEQKYGDGVFLLLEATKKQKKYLLAVTQAGDSSNCFGIVIEKQDNTYGYDLLETIAKITTNVKYERTNTTGKGNVDFDFTNVLK